MLNISRIIGKFIKSSSQRDIDKLLSNKLITGNPELKRSQMKSFHQKLLSLNQKLKME